MYSPRSTKEGARFLYVKSTGWMVEEPEKQRVSWNTYRFHILSEGYHGGDDDDDGVGGDIVFFIFSFTVQPRLTSNLFLAQPGFELGIPLLQSQQLGE